MLIEEKATPSPFQVVPPANVDARVGKALGGCQIASAGGSPFSCIAHSGSQPDSRRPPRIEILDEFACSGLAGRDQGQQWQREGCN